MERPNLIEPGMKYYLKQTLKNCNNVKNYYYNIIFNISIFIIFVIIISVTLYYKYKGVMNKEEKHRREEDKKKYILEKIQKMQKLRKNDSMDLITNLPLWANNN